jgi:hypothetical protein
MTRLRRFVNALREAAPSSEPISPLERRAAKVLILVAVGTAWLSIWVVHASRRNADNTPPPGSADLVQSISVPRDLA